METQSSHGRGISAVRASRDRELSAEAEFISSHLQGIFPAPGEESRPGRGKQKRETAWQGEFIGRSGRRIWSAGSRAGLAGHFRARPSVRKRVLVSVWSRLDVQAPVTGVAPDSDHLVTAACLRLV